MIRLDFPTLLILGLVAGCKTAAVPEDVRDGTLLLAPAGAPRHLVYERDVDLALDALERFLDALPADKVERPAPGRARLDIRRYAMPLVDLSWRIDGEGAKRTLRIAALPADASFPDDPAVDVATAIDRWGGVNGVERGEVETTRVHTPDAAFKTPIADAARAEFRARGLDLVQEEILEGIVCLVARGPNREILWSVLWAEPGTWAVRHHADPFDAEGEQEVLLSIFRRATDLEPELAPIELPWTPPGSHR